MGWLSDRSITYKFKCGSCGKLITREARADQREGMLATTMPCDCGNIIEYAGFEKQEFAGGLICTPFEHNGIKGYKFKSSKGTSYMSASKKGWIDNGKIEPSYTEKFTKHLKDTGQEYMLHSDTSAGKGKAAMQKENTSEN